jgi:formylglycine-generating enzyme required for sulfatase activity
MAKVIFPFSVKECVMAYQFRAGITIILVVAVVLLPGCQSGETMLEASGTPDIAPTQIPAQTDTELPLPTQPPIVTQTFSPTLTPTLAVHIYDDGMEAVFVPAGEFTMGTEDPNNSPPHPVYLEGFWIDKTEVTNAMYAVCVEEGFCEPPGGDAFGNPAYGDYPVVFVDWYQALAYCQWNGRRLPSEAEWEKAARGTDARQYSWGSAEPDCKLINFKGCTGSEPEAVGSYPGDTSPFGALDMTSNASEWTSSLFKPYPYIPFNGREDLLAKGRRTVRGGHANSNIPTITGRYWRRTGETSWLTGFRCASVVKAPDSDATAAARQTEMAASWATLAAQTPTPEPVFISANCSTAGKSPTTISSSDQVILYWRWVAATKDQVIAHWDSANYEITLDGNPIESDSITMIEYDERENYYTKTKYAHIGNLSPGEHYAERRLTWSYQITDGWTVYGPGGEFDELVDGCTIIVEE